MASEYLETDELPEVDQLRMYALPLLQHIIEVTAPDSPVRAQALGEVFTAVVRIREALRPRPTIN